MSGNNGILKMNLQTSLIGKRVLGARLLVMTWSTLEVVEETCNIINMRGQIITQTAYNQLYVDQAPVPRL